MTVEALPTPSRMVTAADGSYRAVNFVDCNAPEMVSVSASKFRYSFDPPAQTVYRRNDMADFTAFGPIFLPIVARDR